MNKKWKKEISISKHLKDKDRVNLSLLRNKEKNYQISSKKNKKNYKNMKTNCIGVIVMKSKTFSVKKQKKMRVVY